MSGCGCDAGLPSGFNVRPFAEGSRKGVFASFPTQAGPVRIAIDAPHEAAERALAPLVAWLGRAKARALGLVPFFASVDGGVGAVDVSEGPMVDAVRRVLADPLGAASCYVVISGEPHAFTSGDVFQALEGEGKTDAVQLIETVSGTPGTLERLAPACDEGSVPALCVLAAMLIYKVACMRFHAVRLAAQIEARWPDAIARGAKLLSLALSDGPESERYQLAATCLRDAMMGGAT